MVEETVGVRRVELRCGEVLETDRGRIEVTGGKGVVGEAKGIG